MTSTLITIDSTNSSVKTAAGRVDRTKAPFWMQFAFTSVERGSWRVRLGDSILGSGPRLPYLCDWPAHVYVHILLPLSSVGGNLPRDRPIRLIEERIIVGRNLAKAAIEVFQLMKLCKVIIG